jgi:hypothetical protein
MKTHLIRLGSVVPHGVGGPEAGLINLLYSFLLHEFDLNVYNHISINQIGNELEECILKDGKNIHINIRYPIFHDFELKTEADRNHIRLDVVNAALEKIANNNKKLDIFKLETIRKKIIEQDFKFEFIYKTHFNRG